MLQSGSGIFPKAQVLKAGASAWRYWEAMELLGDGAQWKEVGSWGVPLKGTLQPQPLPLSLSPPGCHEMNGPPPPCAPVMVVAALPQVPVQTGHLTVDYTFQTMSQH